MRASLGGVKFLLAMLALSFVAAHSPASAQTPSQADEPDIPAYEGDEPDIPAYEGATESDIPAYEGATESDIPAYEGATESDIPAYEERTSDLPASEGGAGMDGSTPPPPSSIGSPVDEIVVTGTQTSSTQAESEAVTTFEQADLDARGILDVETLALNVPALHFGQVGQQAVLTLRGVGTENITSVGESGVGFQIDGVHLGRPASSSALFYDLKAVNVLRGPQGTQGGRNTTGGRVELWSKEPQDELDIAGDITVGDYQTVRPRAVVNVPILGEKLLTRATMVYDYHQGYQENLFTGDDDDNSDDADNFALRGQASSAWLGDRLVLRGVGNYAFQKGNGPAVHLIGPPPDFINETVSRTDLSVRDPSTNAPIGMLPFTVDCTDPALPSFDPRICSPKDPRKSFHELDVGRDNTQNGFTGFLTWDPPWLENTLAGDTRFALIAGYAQNIEDSTTDFDATNIPNTRFDLARDSRQHSVELYIERKDIDWLDYKLGFYYYSEQIDSNFCFDAQGLTQATDAAFIGDIRTESLAGYGEIGVRPHENVRVVGALRYTDETKSADQRNFRFRDFDPGNPNEPHTQVTSGCGYHFTEEVGPDNPQAVYMYELESPPDDKVSWSDFTPRFALEWQMSDMNSASLSITKGFKAGGFPLGQETILDPEFQEPYGAENVWNYELTFKNDFDFFEGGARLNLTFFYTDYEPFQICQFRGPTFNCRDDGDATVRGIELEFDANPITGLYFNGHFNLLDSRVNDFQLIDPAYKDCSNFSGGGTNCPINPPPEAPRPQLPFDVSGNKLPKSPSWAGSFGVEYEFYLGRWGSIIPRFQLQYQARTYFRVFNRNDFSQDAYVKFDTSARWISDDQRWFAEFFVKNITDVDVINSMFVGPQVAGGQVLGQYAAPRLIGARFGVNFAADLIPGL